MASTITLTGDWLISLGNRRQTYGTGNLGTYSTSGIAVSAAQVGLGVINDLIIDPAGGYIFEYVKSTGKVKAYVEGSSLPDVKVTGGQSAGPALQMTPDSAAGVLGKTTATDFTVPGATFGLVAVPAASAEVAGSTNLAGVTFNFRAIGY
jgi:hypothetical protein